MDIDKIVKDSPFIDEWRKEMVSIMKIMNPDWKKKDIEKEIDKMISENLQIPDVKAINNYIGEERETNLISIFDWALEKKPLVAGNGTFYRNQHEAINPVARMLEGFLTKRKALKKEMFKIEDVTSDKYKDLDRSQLNQKINANSYYGASGMPKSAFYSTYSGPSTTGTAQSVISTTKTCFEGFLVNNYKFIDINEAFHFMNIILDQKYKVEKFINRISHKDLYERIVSMFYDDIWDDKYSECLWNFISHLSEEDVTKIYYKYNFIEFTKHPKIKKLYDKLFSSINNYQYAEIESDIPEFFIKDYSGSEKDILNNYNSFVNKEYFMDPNSPPISIENILNELRDYYITYVYVPFMSIDRIHRLKYFKRKTVCIVDTDSNILALDDWVEFCNNELLTSDYNRSEENNRFIMINTLAYFITSAISDTLNEYGLHSNIPDDYRGRFTMKNEFEVELIKNLSNCGELFIYMKHIIFNIICLLSLNY